MRRLFGQLAGVILGAVLASSSPAPVHATSGTSTGTRVALIIVDAASTPAPVLAQAEARLEARSLALVAPGSPGATLVIQPVTDHSFTTPVAGVVTVPAVPAAPKLQHCTSNWDYPCLHHNKEVTAQFQQLLAHDRAQVSAQWQHVLHTTFPRATHTPDVAGAIERDQGDFRKDTNNSLIILGSLSTAPPSGTHFFLRGVDVDVAGRVCTASYTTCASSLKAWRAVFARSGATDTGIFTPEQLSTWMALGVS